ncbi:MAG: response regulator, partial [Deltaproteobacteria bacterium]|nr:response regulator [Deltaproteobacteria bacterium]
MIESTASRDVLFVDDDPDILRALERTSRGAPWRGLFASSAAEGLAHAQVHTFAVVVSDFMMPGMNGVDFLVQIRERQPDAERILLTAHADQEAMEKGINNAGISRFLRKPWKTEALRLTLEEALKQHQLRHDNAVLMRRLAHRNEELGYLNERLQDKVKAGDRDIIAFRRRWDVAFNAISDPMTVVTPELSVEGANRAAGALAGLSADTLEGEKCHVALFKQDAPCHGCPVGSGHGRIEVDAAAGRRLYDVSAYALPGDSPSHLCVYHDVTREVAFA